MQWEKLVWILLWNKRDGGEFEVSHTSQEITDVTIRDLLKHIKEKISVTDQQKRFTM